MIIKLKVLDSKGNFIGIETLNGNGFWVHHLGGSKKIWGDGIIPQAEGDVKFVRKLFTNIIDSDGEELYDGDLIDVYDWGVRSREEILVSNVIIVWDEDENAWSWEKTKESMPPDNLTYEIEMYDRWRNVRLVEAPIIEQ